MPPRKDRPLRTVFALALAVVTLSSNVARAASPDTAPASNIQAVLDARVTSTPGEGIIAGVIDGGKVTVYKAGSSGTSLALDEHTLFEIGSVTKTFTANVLAQMVLDGEVKLNDPVAKYLPSSVHVPSRDGKQITLLNLATQHSGLPRMPANIVAGWNPDNPFAAYSVADLYAFLNSYSLTRDPSATYEYSNLGVGLLGLALAHRAKTNYATLIQQRIFAPLHMHESSVSVGSQPQARLAAGHNIDGDAVAGWTFTDASAGAGAIRASLSDMLIYLRCNMGQGSLAKACLFAQQPRNEFPGGRIGLVWMTNSIGGLINHDGSTGGFRALVAMSPDRSKGVVILSNGPAVDDIGLHLIDASYPIQPEPKVATLDPSLIASYIGTYANATYGINLTIAQKGDRLYAQVAGQPALRIYASRPDHFYYRAVQAYIEFVRQNGKTVGMIFTQNLQNIPIFRLGDDGKPLTTSLEPAYPPVVNLDASTLQSYVGTYDVASGIRYAVTESDGHVFLQITGQPPFEIYPSAKDEFYYKIVDAQVTFRRDAAGKVVGVTLHQNGDDVTGTRR